MYDQRYMSHLAVSKTCSLAGRHSRYGFCRRLALGQYIAADVPWRRAALGVDVELAIGEGAVVESL